MNGADRIVDSSLQAGEADWQRLYKAGGMAALVAAALFRRNLGPELSLIASRQQPETVPGWYSLLQTRPLLGLAYLDFFDVVNCALVGLVFLALYSALKQVDRSLTVIAVAAGLCGITVCFASNTALTMLSLSAEYATATTDPERSMLVAAGRTTLALNQPSAAYASTGTIVRYFLLAVAVLGFSMVMRRSDVFNNRTASVGMLAAVFDLAYIGTFAFIRGIAVYLLPVAGLLLVIWHVLVGIRLYQLGTEDSAGGGNVGSNSDISDPYHRR